MSNTVMYANPNQAMYYMNEYPDDVTALLMVTGTATRVEHLTETPYSRVVYEGYGFTIDAGQLSGGTITGLTGYKDAAPHETDYITSGLSLPVSTWLGFAAGNDGLGLMKYIYGGDDVISNEGNDCPSIMQGYGGNDTITGGILADTVEYFGKRSEYSIASDNSGGYVVTDNTPNRDGVDTLSQVEALKFSDMTVNLTVQAKAAAAPQANVQHLTELYVAFFNRVPDADGLAYWIDQMNGGQSGNQIAESFYGAGVQYSNLTGFSTSMSDQDFINVVYRNVLGRSSGADAAGLDYWSGELASGRASHGSLVSDILNSAHTFKGDATYGWVADLLDNKIFVANKFAVDLGLNYNTAYASITQGMAIAAAVTSTNTSDAIALIGIPGLI